MAGYTECPLGTDLTKYTFQQPFPSSFAPYYVQASNTLTITVSATCFAGWGTQCGITYAGATLTLTYTTGVEAYVESGDGQVGAVFGPTELPLVVRLASADPNTTIPGKTVDFKITTQPARAGGAAVGADEQATTTTYTATADANGLARAILLFGNKEGTYTVEAISPLSNTNVPAKFTATARTPATIRIARRDDGMPDDVYQNPYVVLPMQGARFRTIGYDASGVRIGPVRADWTTTVPKNATDPGAADLSPSLATSFTNFSPTAFGTLTLKAAANPKISGLSGAAAEVKISTTLFVHFEASFNPLRPEDQLPKFVPGSRLDGTSVPPPAAGSMTPVQQVELHILTPPASTGSIRFELPTRSQHPGIAMNWPAQGAVSDDDMFFLDASQQRTHVLPSVPFDPSGDTKVLLYVNDYAASATLTVTVSPTQRTPYTIGPLQLPVDANGNGIPDIGWKALANFATGTYTPIQDQPDPSVDDDATPAATVTQVDYGTGIHYVELGLIGDGLTAFEEYRGAIVRGQHRRMDPSRKDLFAHLDFEVQQFDNVFFKLPLVFHYVDDDEVAADAAKLRPHINPNSDTAGTSPQYALRGRWGANSPMVVDCTDNGRVSPAYTFYYGYTFQVGQDLNQIRYQCAGDPVVLLGSPNETLAVDIFPEAFGKSGINAGDDGILHSIPPCTDPAQTGCDYLDPNGLQIWPGNDRVIDTVLDPRDNYFELLQDCQGRPAFYPRTDLDPLRRQVVAHEGAHGVSVYHPNVIDTTTDRCGTLMYERGDIVPIPTDYDATFDFPQIRIHLKH